VGFQDTDKWGSKLLNLPEMQQITKHLIEVADIDWRKEDSCHDLSSAKL
jgi:hypothetical protein